VPWEHCGRAVADDAACACGLTKEQWTVEFAVTRTFRVSRARGPIRLQVVDAAGEQVVGEPWQLDLGAGGLHEGVTDELGQASVPCPEGVDGGHVRFPRRRPGELRPWRPGGATGADQDGRAPTDGLWPCAPGRRLSLQLGHELQVELGIDPDQPTAGDDRYTLFLTGARERWAQTLTPKDDAVPGDHLLTLVFRGLDDDPSRRYSLEVDPGADGRPYLVVDGLTFAALRDGPRRSHPDDEETPPADALHPEDEREVIAPGA
jgi:hypothetical protein